MRTVEGRGSSIVMLGSQGALLLFHGSLLPFLLSRDRDSLKAPCYLSQCSNGSDNEMRAAFRGSLALS